MCAFQLETCHISKTVRDRAKVSLLPFKNRKWHTLFQMRLKKSSTLDDLVSQYRNKNWR